jgi:hypothetical protein
MIMLAGKGALVMLLPSKIETMWFQRYVWNKETGTWYDGVKVEFLTPRVRFIDAIGRRQNRPAFGSVIVIFFPFAFDFVNCEISKMSISSFLRSFYKYKIGV